MREKANERKILLLNGPNLNLLGKREPEIYGAATLDAIVGELEIYAKSRRVCLIARQSNSEGELVSLIQMAMDGYDGIIFNAGGYTHTSVALRDAIAAVAVPCVEVHLSNVFARESFRHCSLLAPVCAGQISGFGDVGYRLALDGLLHRLDADVKKSRRGEL